MKRAFRIKRPFSISDYMARKPQPQYCFFSTRKEAEELIRIEKNSEHIFKVNETIEEVDVEDDKILDTIKAFIRKKDLDFRASQPIVSIDDTYSPFDCDTF